MRASFWLKGGAFLFSSGFALACFSSVHAAGATDEMALFSERIGWLLPPVAVLVAIAFYLAFSFSAVGSLGLRRQLAQRVRAEERLRLLYSAVEQSSEGMAVSDLDGNIIFVNHAFAAMHDYTPEELKGRNLKTLHSSNQMPAVDDSNERLLRQGVFAGEVWHRRRDGTVFPAFMHNSVLRADDGRPMGLIGAMRDITGQKEAEARLKDYSERLEQMVEERTKALDRARAELFTSSKLAAMGRMGAGIAHQLNSPLCGGLLIIDSLMDDSGKDPLLKKRLGMLRQSLEGMRDIIECMLSMAMVGRRGRSSMVDLNVNEMLQRILGFAGLYIQKRGIRVNTEFAQSLPAIRAKTGELDQVFLNIINNAIDSMKDGGTLSVTTKAGGENIRVSIADTGRGIASEHINRIFEPFFTTSQGRKGLGLGLSIARDIVESYGGKIDVQSRVGHGSEFIVTISLKTG